MNIRIIGVAGGSGSGKTTLAKKLVQDFGTENCHYIAQDNYYFDHSKKFDFDGGSVNFDHPEAIEFSLLAQHLRELKQGREIHMPQYDFVTHSRMVQSIPIRPRSFIIVDGILILSQEILRPLFDKSIFVSTTEQLRYERRLARDVSERGRTPEGVRAQFYKQVKPMHDQFVDPSAKYADLVLSGEKPFNDDLILI